MAGARQARKHPAICQVTWSKPPKPAGLPPAWLHLTVTAWRPYGTRDPGDPRARLTHGSPVSLRADSATCAPVVCGGGRSSGPAGGSPARGVITTKPIPIHGGVHDWRRRLTVSTGLAAGLVMHPRLAAFPAVPSRARPSGEARTRA
jgi:hypothetical protein